jgi:hypothetical protein
MKTLRLVPSRASPAVPGVDGSTQSHLVALKVLTEHAETGARRTQDVLNSYVRVRDLVDLGVIRVDDDTLAVTMPPLAPSMTTSERDGMFNVSDGTLILNTTTNKIQARVAGAWVDLH